MEIEKVMTPRFRAIVSLVPLCNTVADIGTDHAYIPVWLIKNNIAQRAIAMDIKKGPLERAKATVDKFEVTDKTELRLSDGLEKLLPDEADCIVIAGMGGLLVNDILAANAKKHKNALFILQPMTAEDEVRRYLEKSGFAIIDECLAREENKVYHVMAVRFGKMETENELFYHLGKKLFENNDPTLKVAIEKLIKKYSVILDGLKEAQCAHEEKKVYAEKMLKMLTEQKEKLK